MRPLAMDKGCTGGRWGTESWAVVGIICLITDETAGAWWLEYVVDGPGRYLSTPSAPAQLLHDQRQTVGKKWDPRSVCLGSESLEA